MDIVVNLLLTDNIIRFCGYVNERCEARLTDRYYHLILLIHVNVLDRGIRESLDVRAKR